MAKRAEMIGAHFELVSDSKGTTVLLESDARPRRRLKNLRVLASSLEVEVKDDSAAFCDQTFDRRRSPGSSRRAPHDDAFLKEVDVVAACGTGAEALKIIAQQPVDILLADMRMAPMDGIQMIRAIKNNRFPLRSSFSQAMNLKRIFIKLSRQELMGTSTSMRQRVNYYPRFAGASGERVFSPQILENSVKEALEERLRHAKIRLCR